MNWPQQVWHVLSKDIRQARGYLAAWAAATVLAGIVGMGPIVPSFATLDVLAGVVFVLGVLALAGIVQSDSPTRVGSYWSTLPLSPTAVLAAKLLLTLAIVLLPTIVAFLVFGSLGVPAGAAAAPILLAAAGCGLFLLALFVIAALTTGLRDFFLVILLIPVAVLLLPQAFEWMTHVQLDPDQMAPGVPVTVALLAGAGVLLLLADVYRRRDLRRAIWLPGLYLASTAMVAPFMRSTGMIAGPPMPPHPVLQFRMAPDTTAGTLTPYHANMSVSVDGAPADLRVQLMAEASVLHLRDGRTIQMGRRPQLITAHRATIAAFEGLQWPYASPEHDAIFALAPDPRAPAPQPGAVASVEVFAEVRLARLVPLGAIALAPGGTFRAAGGRVRLMGFSHRNGSVLVTTRVLTANGSPEFDLDTPFNIYGDLNLSLINESRHEAMALSPAGFFGGDVWLVMPGVRGRDYDVKFATKQADFGGSAPTPNDEWYAGADVQLATWVPQPGYYQVHLIYTSPTDKHAATSRGVH